MGSLNTRKFVGRRDYEREQEETRRRNEHDEEEQTKRGSNSSNERTFFLALQASELFLSLVRLSSSNANGIKTFAPLAVQKKSSPASELFLPSTFIIVRSNRTKFALKLIVRSSFHYRCSIWSHRIGCVLRVSSRNFIS